MLKNILNLDGAQELSKEQQRKVLGSGSQPPEGHCPYNTGCHNHYIDSGDGRCAVPYQGNTCYGTVVDNQCCDATSFTP